MYRPNNRSGVTNAVPPKHFLAAKRRRQLHPFFYSMGPVALSVCSVLLVGLMAILYLTQLGQAVTANQTLQNTYTQQSLLQRENQDLTNTIAQEESPSYIAEHAKSLGLVPVDTKTVRIVVVKGLKPIVKNEPHIQP